MNTKELKAYLKEATFFKLKDRQKTSDKYKGYKNDKFNKLLEDDNDNTTSGDFEKLFSYNFNPYGTQDLENKSWIRRYATEINYIMSEELKKYIERISDYNLNDNEKKCFAIKYYLAFYKEINEAMTTILTDQILWTE